MRGGGRRGEGRERETERRAAGALRHAQGPRGALHRATLTQALHGQRRYEVRVEDPDVLLEPWNMTPRTVRLNPNPKAFLIEDPPCVERDFSHMTSRERG